MSLRFYLMKIPFLDFANKETDHWKQYPPPPKMLFHVKIAFYGNVPYNICIEVIHMKGEKTNYFKWEIVILYC